MFQKSQEKIYLFFNIWTSLNNYILIKIVLYFVDNDYQVRTILLDIREIYREHSNKNVDQTIVNVIYEFQTKSKLDTFVLNNVDNNDIIICYVLNKFELHDTYKEEHCQLCCLDYIINLIV